MHAHSKRGPTCGLASTPLHTVGHPSRLQHWAASSTSDSSGPAQAKRGVPRKGGARAGPSPLPANACLLHVQECCCCSSTCRHPLAAAAAAAHTHTPPLHSFLHTPVMLLQLLHVRTRPPCHLTCARERCRCRCRSGAHPWRAVVQRKPHMCRCPQLSHCVVPHLHSEWAALTP